MPGLFVRRATCRAGAPSLAFPASVEAARGVDASVEAARGADASVETGRGDAVAATWMFCGDEDFGGDAGPRRG